MGYYKQLKDLTIEEVSRIALADGGDNDFLSLLDMATR